jgi:F0F1-type ATP synthase assembly protein I
MAGVSHFLFMDKTDKTPWWKPGIVIFTKVLAAVVVPIVLALFIGKWLDTRYGTSPWIFLGLTAVSFVISLVTIYRSLTKYMESLKNDPPAQTGEEKKK